MAMNGDCWSGTVQTSTSAPYSPPPSMGDLILTAYKPMIDFQLNQPCILHGGKLLDCKVCLPPAPPKLFDEGAGL